MKAFNIIDNIKENDNKLICGFMKIAETGKGRILLPGFKVA